MLGDEGGAILARDGRPLAPATLPALAETWTIDASHSTVGFSVRHMMVSNVRGSFGTFTARVDGSPADPSTAKISATIEVASVDTREPKRDEHLRAADFFDAAKFPRMTFTSTKVEKVSATKAKVTGDLTLRGVTKPVTLDVEYTQPVKNPWGKTIVGASATAKLNRKDFGVNWSKSLDGGGLVVGDEVELTYDMSKVLGVRQFAVEGARTVHDIVRMTRDKFGERAESFDQLARVAAVVVNGVLINHKQGMRTPLADGDTVTFFKAAAGG